MAKLNTDFFKKKFGESFTDLFNTKLGGNNHWGVNSSGQGKSYKIVEDGDTKLSRVFTPKNIKILTGRDDINIYEFLAIVSIIINETGGKIDTKIPEYGSLEYMYESNSNGKGSYNCKPNTGYSNCSVLGNKTAYELFHDTKFLNVDSRKTMYKPKNLDDKAWKGPYYPDGEPKGVNNQDSTKNYSIGGIIAECDFYKFRGRGLIQFTGRGNYMKWLSYLNENKNNISYTKETSKPIINTWGNKPTDEIATIVTNKELDTLMSDQILSLLTVKVHSSNQILKQLSDPKSKEEVLDLMFNYGHRISGSQRYGNLFAGRIYDIIEVIGGIK